MASSLLRRRKVSAFGISRILQDNVEPIQLDLKLKLGAVVCLCGLFRQYSSSSSNGTTTKFDFTDLTRPDTWYPNARRKNRKVILHVGPTNSGKTYHALKQLESSRSGIYCGPLRLLAWEVAQRLNKAKVPCDLITGQEREEIDGAKHKAVTVEMADVTSDYHCAVIDEIQMLGCRTRGFSFTRALLGISADELHLCGDPAAVPLIQEILKVTGDDVKVQSYERLSPLVPLKVPLGSFNNIQTGDCIVTFSRHEIYRLKKQIENEGKHLCSVVYGSLPPETRTRQATMFNDASSEFDVLVASDAIGMGLNLNISRIIFSTLKKFDGFETRELTVPEIKQIAGRAGRYGSKFPVGEVTCLDADDLPLLHSSLKSPSPSLERAGLFPTFDLMFMYSRLHPKHSLHEILEHFLENAKLSDNYFIANCEEMLKVAVVIDELPLGLHDKYLFCISPVDMNDEISSQGLTQFAQNYAKRGIVRLKEIFTPGTLQVPKTQTALKELESIHKVLDLYVWLSFRLEDSFPDRELASSQKAICSLLIEEFLERLGWQRPRARKLPRRTSLSSLLSKDIRQYLSKATMVMDQSEPGKWNNLGRWLAEYCLNLFRSPVSYVEDFVVPPGRMLSGRGCIIVHLNDLIFRVMEGGTSVMKVSVKVRAPRLHYIYPTCFEAGKPMEFLACGSNLLQPKFRFLVSFAGKYLASDYRVASPHGRIKGDSSSFDHQLYEIYIPHTEPNFFGPAFVEVENESGLSNFIPVLIGDKEICSEIKTIQERFDASLFLERSQFAASGSLSDSCEVATLRQTAFSELLLDIAWLLKEPASEDFQQIMVSSQIQRFNCLLNFLIHNESIIILEKLLANMEIMMDKMGSNNVLNGASEADMRLLQKYMDKAREILHQKFQKSGDLSLRLEHTEPKENCGSRSSSRSDVPSVAPIPNQDAEMRANGKLGVFAGPTFIDRSETVPLLNKEVVMNINLTKEWPIKSCGRVFSGTVLSSRPAIFVIATAAVCFGICVVLLHPQKVGEFAVSIRRCLSDKF